MFNTHKFIKLCFTKYRILISLFIFPSNLIIDLKDFSAPISKRNSQQFPCSIKLHSQYLRVSQRILQHLFLIISPSQDYLGVITLQIQVSARYEHHLRLLVLSSSRSRINLDSILICIPNFNSTIKT